ncbi:MAG: hypothetical protein IT370_12395 [Deltaproteobacteria bacterium]|nr:hypothetical protein [Deltaproteobacteria bacterium]
MIRGSGVVVVLVLALGGCRKTPRRAGVSDASVAARAVAADAGALVDAAVATDSEVEADADAEVPGVLRGEPALGPFAAPEELCPALLARLEAAERDRASCARDGAPGSGAAPYLGTHTWQFEDPDEAVTRYLVFQLDGRWFAAAAGGFDMMNTSNGDVTVGRPSARDVIPGGAPELLFDVVETNSDMDDFDNVRFDEVTRRTVCSTGPSGQPSCVAVTLAGRGENHSDFAERKRYRFALECPFQPDGRVACRLRGKRPDPDLVEGLEDTFTLVFP